MKLIVQKTNGTKKTFFPDKILFTKNGIFIKKGNRTSLLKETVVEILGVE